MRHFLDFLLSILPVDPVARAVALGQLRHVLGILGTLLASGGVIAADKVGPLVEAAMQVAGFALVVGAMYASWRDKVTPPPADAASPVSRTLGALLALALLPGLAACDSLSRAAVPLLATLAPATACALDIFGAVQAPGETHQSDTEKAVASAVLLTTDPKCLNAAVVMAGLALSAVSDPERADAAAAAASDALLAPPTLPATR